MSPESRRGQRKSFRARAAHGQLPRQSVQREFSQSDAASSFTPMSHVFHEQTQSGKGRCKLPGNRFVVRRVRPALTSHSDAGPCPSRARRSNTRDPCRGRSRQKSASAVESSQADAQVTSPGFS